jgi:mono/diheme cytochrome c family protein
MRTSNIATWLGALTLAALPACSDNASDKPSGSGGAGGTNSSSGGSSAHSGASGLSERASVGLSIAPSPLSVAGKTTPELESIGRGSYLVNAGGVCMDCHSTRPTTTSDAQYLAGNVKFAIAPSLYVYARNLTPDPETGMKLTRAEFIETMRTGKGFKNSPPGETPQVMFAMPWMVYRWLSDVDLNGIYDYLQVIPPIHMESPPDNKGPAAAVPPTPFPAMFDEGDELRSLPPDDASDPDHALRGLALQPLADASTSMSPSEKQLFGRGSYLANAISNCNNCHTNPDRGGPGPDYLKVTTSVYLTGGLVFGVPEGLKPIIGETRVQAANLVGTHNGWSNNADLDTFLRLIREGTHVDEASNQPVGFPMPTQFYKNMVQSDLEAIFVYMNRVARTENNDNPTQETARYCDADEQCKFEGEHCNVDAHECVGKACTGTGYAIECGACQSCVSGACAAPEPDDACLQTMLQIY